MRYCWAKWVFSFCAPELMKKATAYTTTNVLHFLTELILNPDTLGQSKNLLCVQACVMRGQAKIKQREKLIQPALFI